MIFIHVKRIDFTWAKNGHAEKSFPHEKCEKVDISCEKTAFRTQSVVAVRVINTYFFKKVDNSGLLIKNSS